MIKIYALALLLLLVAVSAQAQTGTPASTLVWDQAAPSLAVANAYTYRYYADGATTPASLSGVTCTGTTSPYVCRAAFPAFTPGAHTVALSASNSAGESPRSMAFSFAFVVIPTTPANIRIE